MNSLRNKIKIVIRESLNDNEDSNKQIIIDVAKELANKMHCDRFGSCVHFAEEFVLKINEINPRLLSDFNVIEGFVDWSHGDDIPQQHTWIEFLDGSKIDPTFQQFTKYGTANYSTKRRKKFTGETYYNDTVKGTWFSDRRKKHPEQYLK